jgi:sulfite exporter TauE/SafE
MNEILTVSLLGLSAEGLVICPFFAFGLSLSDRAAALRFLSGRITGLILFGAAITLFGRLLPIKESFVNIFFGATLLALGIFRIIKSRQQLEFLSDKKSNGPLGLGCKSDVSGKIGFGLGLYRGFLNPGRKYAYLAPLLLSAGLFKGLAISFAFGVSSSVYLALGFLSAKALETLTPHKRAIGLCGGGVLIIMGLIYGWRGFQGLS